MHKDGKGYIARAKLVSVPLRGKYRGESRIVKTAYLGASVFPSPCGVNIVANLIVVEVSLITPLVSVPLRGKYRGEWCNLRL